MWFHFLMLLFIVPLAFTALLRGYRQHHRVPPIVLGLIGCCALAIGLIAPLFIDVHDVQLSFLPSSSHLFSSHDFDALATSLGGLFLIAAHLTNLFAQRSALVHHSSHRHEGCNCAKS
jgi:hypothetical protein